MGGENKCDIMPLDHQDIIAANRSQSVGQTDSFTPERTEAFQLFFN
jgi:hypothetical protein